jgi:hypothetical protein
MAVARKGFAMDMLKGVRLPSLRFAALCLAALGSLLAAGGSIACAQVPTPASVLGHTPGDDFYLATYEDAWKYFTASS